MPDTPVVSAGQGDLLSVLSELSLAYGDRRRSNADQARSDRAQVNADKDQVAADREQVASDHSLACGLIHARAHALSRDIRQLSHARSGGPDAISLA